MTSRRSFLSALFAAPLVPLALTSDERRKRDLETLKNIAESQARLSDPGYWVTTDKIYITQAAGHVWEPLEVTWSIPHDRTEWTS